MARLKPKDIVYRRWVDWSAADLKAKLVSPVSKGGGAQTMVPRAQGQLIAALIDDEFSERWKSSDQLSIKVESL